MEGFWILVSSNTDLLEQEKVFTQEKGLSRRIGLEHRHGRRLIVLGHQYGRRDVMWKHYIHRPQSVRTVLASVQFATGKWQ